MVLELRILFIIGYGGSLQEVSRKGGSNEMQLIISQFKFWFMEYQFQIFEVFYMYSRVWQHACILSRFSRGRRSDVWTVARQTLLSMGVSRQEQWSGLPFPYPGDLPNPEIEPPFFICLLHQEAGSLPLAPPGEPNLIAQHNKYAKLFNEQQEGFLKTLDF